MAAVDEQRPRLEADGALVVQGLSLALSLSLSLSLLSVCVCQICTFLFSVNGVWCLFYD